MLHYGSSAADDDRPAHGYVPGYSLVAGEVIGAGSRIVSRQIASQLESVPSGDGACCRATLRTAARIIHAELRIADAPGAIQTANGDTACGHAAVDGLVPVERVI